MGFITGAVLTQHGFEQFVGWLCFLVCCSIVSIAMYRLLSGTLKDLCSVYVWALAALIAEICAVLLILYIPLP